MPSEFALMNITVIKAALLTEQCRLHMEHIFKQAVKYNLQTFKQSFDNDSGAHSSSVGLVDVPLQSLMSLLYFEQF